MRDDWEIRELGDICGYQNGFAFKSKTYRDSGTPVIRISDIQNERIDASNIVHVNRDDYDRDLSRYEVKEGDLLIAMSGATTGKIGLVETDETFLLNQRVGKFEPGEDLDKKYLFYYLLEKVEEVLKMSSGSAQPNLSTGQIKAFKIPVPSLDEQKRIVSILDEAFDAIDQAKSNIKRNVENAEDLFQSKLNNIFEKKAKAWRTDKLGEVTEINMGQSPKSSTYNDKANGTPLINGPVEFGPKPFSKTVKSKWTTDPNKMCKKNDLILCVRGSTTGRINIAGFDACIGRGVASLRYRKNQRWLNYFIRAKQDFIYNLGSGSTFPNVSGKDLKKINFPNPPLDIQQPLIKVMDSLLVNKNKVVKMYKKKVDLFNRFQQSILQRAFSGELTKKELVG